MAMTSPRASVTMVVGMPSGTFGMAIDAANGLLAFDAAEAMSAKRFATMVELFGRRPGDLSSS